MTPRTRVRATLLLLMFHQFWGKATFPRRFLQPLRLSWRSNTSSNWWADIPSCRTETRSPVGRVVWLLPSPWVFVCHHQGSCSYSSPVAASPPLRTGVRRKQQFSWCIESSNFRGATDCSSHLQFGDLRGRPSSRLAA